MHLPNAQELQAIVERRDPRYDGRLYFGVKTTRIYCRPICPARPKLENIVLFKSLSEAERSGYRPCLRCRPDAAPGSKLFDGTWNTVSRALRLIEAAEREDLSVETLANSLGVTDRHLRRLFDDRLGASPIEIMVTQRLHFAKQTLRETTLPIAEIAHASGFKSLRRFNEAFKTRFHTPPSQFRKAQKQSTAGATTLQLPIRKPYDWDTVLSYLLRHETYGVEKIAGNTYRRFLPTRQGFGTISVSRPKNAAYLQLELTDIPINAMRLVVSRIKSLFDTDHDPSTLVPTATLVPRGIRVPGGFDPFETAVSIVLGQLVSTENARARLRKLMETYGQRLGDNDSGDPVLAFPAPATLARAKLETLGLTRTMAAALRELAKGVATGTIDFRAPTTFDDATSQLLAIKGIGPWTAAMMAMRCLGHPDAFPATDLIVKRAMEQNLVDEASWPASRAYLVHCLWRDYSQTLSKAKKGPK